MHPDPRTTPTPAGRGVPYRHCVVVALFVSLAVLAGACTGDGSLSASRQSPERGVVDPGAGSPGSLTWARCTEEPASLAGLECASLKVPLDPSAPDGDSIDLALARSRATAADRLGSVVLNPGGPGGSGIEFLAAAATAFPDAITRRFDLVSFDPRGVGQSTPVRCLDDDDKDAQLEGDLSPGDDTEVAEALQDVEEFREGCLTRAGELIRYMSTADVAADLDRIREALGDERLTYVGFSYGTSIGATYATLFPDRVRALVLDGAVSPGAPSDERLLAQGRGFENTFTRFVETCDLDPQCALGPDAAASIAAVRSSLEREPVEVDTPSGTRKMGIDLFDIALATALYDTSLWGVAASAVADVGGSGGVLLFSLVDRQVGRNPDGTYDNSSDAQTMVNCADEPERPTVDEAVEQARRIGAELPTFGHVLGWGALACIDWPEPANPLPDVDAADAPPILVIGTLGDPATPYVWSQQMAEALGSGVLVTYEGDGHTAFLRAGPCIDDLVTAYLIDLTVPPGDPRCPASDQASFRGLRDEVVSQLVDAGLPDDVAECVVDGMIDEVGAEEFDRLILGNDFDQLTELVTEQSLRCATGG
jgi:pimeloyl-ACP methyl ester carboxylesterase